MSSFEDIDQPKSRFFRDFSYAFVQSQQSVLPKSSIEHRVSYPPWDLNIKSVKSSGAIGFGSYFCLKSRYSFNPNVAFVFGLFPGREEEIREMKEEKSQKFGSGSNQGPPTLEPYNTGGI